LEGKKPKDTGQKAKNASPCTQRHNTLIVF
jgi:hypothetical protein